MFLGLSAAEITIYPIIPNAYMEESIKREKNEQEKVSFVLNSTRPIIF